MRSRGRAISHGLIIRKRSDCEKKNQTDGAHTPPLVPLRYVLAFVTTVTTESRRFFVEAGISGEELQKLEDAWAKTVHLHVTLWARPYLKEGLW
jgi:hypothetical protein